MTGAEDNHKFTAYRIFEGSLWTDPHTVDAANRAVDTLRPQTGESCDIEGRGQPGLRRHFCTSYIPVGWLL